MKTSARYSQTMRLDLPLDTSSRAAIQSEAPKINTAKNTPNTQTEFDQLLETLYDAVILTDRNGNLVTANQRTLDFLQIALDVLLQCNIAHIIAGASQNILDTVLENIKEHRFTLIQAFCIRSDKSTFPAEVSVTSVVRNGQDCLCFSIRDTTLRRQVEERLRIEGEAIRNAGDGIVITDTEGIITYANPAVGRLWNIDDPEDITDQPILNLFPESQAIEDAVNAAVAKGSWNGELEANKTDGDAFFLQVHITASLDEDEYITHLVFSFADITQRRQGEIALLEYQNHLEDLIRQRTANLESTNAELIREIEERRTIENQLREAIQKLREHDNAKSTFVSNVSHELRTPLTSLIKSLENLMRGVVGEVSDPVASYFSMMLEDCWRLERTIHDILDLSRIEKGTFKLVRHPVPFTCLMQRTAESIRMSAESIPLTYTVSRSPLGGFVDCDGTKIERVLINILSNALKFTPPNGRCTVTFEHIERNGKAALACDVTDSGVGIPADLIDRVTERFFRIGEQVEGTGLGLAIAREVAEKHGGGIEIMSPPPSQDSGTLVRLWLPRLPPTHTLVVYPETDICKELCANLAQREYTVEQTDSGTTAIQKLRDGDFSMALIGANLSDISGTETIMHIMADASLRNRMLFYLSDQPLDPTKSGLLHGLQIPHIMLSHGSQTIINQIERRILSLSRTQHDYDIVDTMHQKKRSNQ